MCSLFINDLDAGAGRMGEATQYTVNNQMVNATLMNITARARARAHCGTHTHELLARPAGAAFQAEPLPISP
jgi:hypothetical protein